MGRKSIEVKIGNTAIGGDNPVRVQSMTNTLTADFESTAKQIIELAEAGSELVRITIKDEKDAEAVEEIKVKLEQSGCNIPLIGDFHYNGHRLLKRYPSCAMALDKYRINPGNVGKEDNFRIIIEKAIEYNKPVRIGVNAGSIEVKDNLVNSMVRCAIESAQKAESIGLSKNKIVLSAKASKVNELIQVYERLAETEYALHLGLTEAGIGDKGIIASTAGLSVLLNKGIGDTIRVSLTPTKDKKRAEEVIIAQQILQLNGIRNFMPVVVSCPGCGRTSSTLFQEIAEEITNYLKEKTPEWKKRYHGIENMSVAVMGCVVNGPGESKEANIGLSLPGDNEEGTAVVYSDGNIIERLQGDEIIPKFKQMIQEYVDNKYWKDF